MSCQTDSRLPVSRSPFTLFVSDLHLTPERPLPVQLWQKFVGTIAPGAQALYILGDFFESWVGDDELEHPFNQTICQSLRSVSDAGVQVCFLPGNRDFLVGRRFAEAAGLKLLLDPSEINLYGVSTLLAHGDQFCTDDLSYQAFRRQVRDPVWQQQFLALPLAQRQAMATSARERSEQAKAGNKPEIMDVNREAVASILNGLPNRRLIHGHTHRPGQHIVHSGDAPLERWVLPDWYDRGGYLICDETGCRLVELT
jgi:UDP-2,3-diacylglucosamine hydrolase